MSENEIWINAQNDHRFAIKLSEENANSDSIALLLPGLGYRTHHPIFYFTEQLLHQKGLRTAHVNYHYDLQNGFRDLAFDDAMLHLEKDAELVAKALEQLSRHEELIFVGKSLGTVMMANLLSLGVKNVKQMLWLTPSLGLERVHEQIEQNAGQSFVAIGTNDKAYDKKLLQRFILKGAALCELEGLAHIFEAGNDVTKGILGHHQMIAELEIWLGQNDKNQ